eukprot:CAMPEP_0117440646 /NCGR_PEP_ID=MMETSP0759-20121206/3205_1 /TAXON_ID=63605 /ORGANISM="Percolomonas cosmopolitus, Strain WS" /LENGTH=600 /DNA_ID=CAMNT_0005232433 /DNA_START=155 /DNA_END=1957 /DNA_ORIENTATION=-
MGQETDRKKVSLRTESKPVEEAGAMIQYDDDEEEEDDVHRDHDAQANVINTAITSASAASEPQKIPIKNHVTIIERPKPISALSIDQKSQKIAIGDHAFSMRLFDLREMDMHLRPYRELDNWLGSYKINDVQWNNNAELILVIPDSKQPKLFTAEGQDKGIFAAGDMYLVEKARTKGHTAAVKCGQWHPWKHTVCMTGSLDGTVRLWNSAGRFRSGCDQVIKVRSGRKNFDPIYSCAFTTRVGDLIACGTGSGSVVLYPSNGPYTKSSGCCDTVAKNAASRFGTREHSIISLQFSQDGHTLAARSLDHKLLIFDIRQFNAPVQTFHDLPCNYEETDVIFSPNDQFIVSGTSGSVEDSTESNGNLVLVDKNSMQIVHNAPLDDAHGGLIRMCWPQNVNQLFVTTSAGELIGYYDEDMGSTKGILKPLSKGYKKKALKGHSHTEVILNPLQMESEMSQKLREKRKEDRQFAPKAERRSGPGFGGQLGTSQIGSTLKKLGVGISQEELRENPRDAILKYAKEAEENPRYVTQAYKDTQPKAILDYESAYREHDEQLKKDQMRAREAEARARFNTPPTKKRRFNDEENAESVVSSWLSDFDCVA